MNKIVSAILMLLLSLFAKAQESNYFELDQCIKYALENHETVKNAQLDLKIAEADIKEIRGIGLPQINAEGEFTYLYQIPVTVLDVSGFNPTLPEGTLQALPFGVDFSSKANITASQLLFNGSYLVGLKAATLYKELMANSLGKSKRDVVESVMKAYYNVLVTNERVKTLGANLNLLDTMYYQTNKLYEAGFIEEIEVLQLKVKLENLKIEQDNVNKLKELAYQLLKYQIGMNMDEDLEVAQNIADFKIPIVDDTQSSNPNGRIEFVLLKQQKQLLELDLLNQKANYLPTLAGFATYGQTNQVSDFSDAFDKEWWFPTGVVGARLSIPIFTGFQNRYKVQKSQISIQKTENQLKTAERSFSLQFNQAQIALKNAIATLESKKSTMELSEKVYQSIVKKYKNGTTDVLAVTSSYTDFRTAETAYLEGVYDVVMAKLELDIASGKLKY